MLKLQWRLVLVCVLSVGCGESPVGVRDGGVDSEVGPGTTRIRSAEGGTATDPSGRFRLQIPPGALAEDTEISIRQASDAELEAALDTATVGFVLEPDGLTFREPVRVEWSVPEAVEDGAIQLGTIDSISLEHGVEGISTGEVVVGADAVEFHAELTHFSVAAWTPFAYGGLVNLQTAFGPRSATAEETHEAVFTLRTEGINAPLVGSAFVAGEDRGIRNPLPGNVRTFGVEERASGVTQVTIPWQCRADGDLSAGFAISINVDRLPACDSAGGCEGDAECTLVPPLTAPTEPLRLCLASSVGNPSIFSILFFHEVDCDTEGIAVCCERPYPSSCGLSDGVACEESGGRFVSGIDECSPDVCRQPTGVMTVERLDPEDVPAGEAIEITLRGDVMAPFETPSFATWQAVAVMQDAGLNRPAERVNAEIVSHSADELVVRAVTPASFELGTHTVSVELSLMSDDLLLWDSESDRGAFSIVEPELPFEGVWYVRSSEFFGCDMPYSGTPWIFWPDGTFTAGTGGVPEVIQSDVGQLVWLHDGTWERDGDRITITGCTNPYPEIDGVSWDDAPREFLWNGTINPITGELSGIGAAQARFRGISSRECLERFDMHERCGGGRVLDCCEPLIEICSTIRGTDEDLRRVGSACHATSCTGIDFAAPRDSDSVNRWATEEGPGWDTVGALGRVCPYDE
ncbi:MAG: hypothetical protein AAGE52_10120 [Myxococcota bacterium]